MAARRLNRWVTIPAPSREPSVWDAVEQHFPDASAAWDRDVGDEPWVPFLKGGTRDGRGVLLAIEERCPNADTTPGTRVPCRCREWVPTVAGDPTTGRWIPLQ